MTKDIDIFMKSLTLKNSAYLIYKDFVGVIWSDLVEIGLQPYFSKM